MAKKKSRSLMVTTLRLNPNHYEKLGYLAEEQGLTIADVTRNIIATAVRGVTPPKQLKAREIVSSEGEWESWEKVAVSMNTTTDKLVARLMNGLAIRAGLAPLAPDQQTE